jgi:hypothetical protein
MPERGNSNSERIIRENQYGRNVLKDEMALVHKVENRQAESGERSYRSIFRWMT